MNEVLERLQKTLNEASAEVATWPQWKRDVYQAWADDLRAGWSDPCRSPRACDINQTCVGGCLRTKS